MQTVNVQDLGRIDFRRAWDYQQQLLDGIVGTKLAVRDGRSREATRHYLLFCEHPPVYTLGKSGNENHLLIDRQRMEAEGARFYRINRGGDITFHGPGQVVVYPVLDLDMFFNDIHRYLRSLEEVVIRMLAGYGIRGRRIEKCTGVWVDDRATGRPAKVCAFGVRCSRWVTMHGLALNVNTDLSWFGHIVPCGIADKGVTSMQRELGRPVDAEGVKESLKRHFAGVFGAVLAEEAGRAALPVTS